MIEAYLIRDIRSPSYTLGKLVIKGNILVTIERAWLDNKRNESCIPNGRYLCRYLERSSSGKYKNCYHVTGVEGRSGILIHNGNLASHSKGCIIIGSRRGWLNGLRAVLASKTALAKLSKITNKQDFYLTVTGG